jgi:hypothetical protein
MINRMLAFFSTCCPYCKSIDFRSVGLRNGFERTFRWLFQPYRCCLCGRHFCLIRRAPAIGDAV